AAISGGCRPWQSDSPQPVMPSSVTSSTTMVLRRVTQPIENANGSSSGVESTWVLIAVIFMGRELGSGRRARRTGIHASLQGIVRRPVANSRGLGPAARRLPQSCPQGHEYAFETA